MNDRNAMPLYQSSRIVNASKIVLVHDGRVKVENGAIFKFEDDVMKRIELAGGVGAYLIGYDDGFFSACPADSFEPNYVEIF